MKLIKRFALLAIVMISIQVYGQSDTTSPPQIDTIMYIHDSNRTTVVTIHPPSNKVEEKLDTCYSYVFVPRHYIPFSKGRWTRVDAHWDTIPCDTLYVNPLYQINWSEEFNKLNKKLDSLDMNINELIIYEIKKDTL
tara:strand:- start:28 stop:438 length:411 start_codon:yes stop_codon:yes gene_type:complete